MRRTLLNCVSCLALCLAASFSTSAFGQTAGVHVDADGVLSRLVSQDRDGQLHQQAVAAARASLNAEIARSSKLRKVSLVRLEKAIEAQIAAGKPLSDDLLYLAGLQRIQYVFCYPASGEVVIAGPAEGWVKTPAGRVVGLESSQPVVRLEDLVAALRTFAPSEKKNPLIGCSIDPTQEGLQRMQEFLARMGRNLSSANSTQFIVNGLKQSLGAQTITVFGVPASTHFAQVMVEADYRMKLIGIGLEQPPVEITSYVATVNPATVAANAMQRWYFVPDYQCLTVSEDKTAIELHGRGVKLVGEQELVGQNGQRAAAGAVNTASQRFTHSFTQKYPDLAEASPVYAELRNCIDLAVTAAWLQQSDVYTKTDWKMSTLGDERLFEIETYNVPAKVESAINAIWKRNMLMTPIGGGVQLRPRDALKPANLRADDDHSVSQAQQSVTLNLEPGIWWWD